MPRPGRSQQLVLAAERLFAQHGLDGVSLRQIVAAGGLRNPAAVQYHFGDKAGLVRAVIEYRVKALNSRRQEMLDALVADGRSDDLRGLVEAIARPLLEVDPRGSYYVEFLARLHDDPEIGRIFDVIDDEYGSSGRFVRQLLEEALGELTPEIRRHRVDLALDVLLHGLALRQSTARRSKRAPEPDDVLFDDLLDCATGLLAAPSTDRTSATRSASAS